jgi:hypothetical protein
LSIKPTFLYVKKGEIFNINNNTIPMSGKFSKVSGGSACGGGKAGYAQEKPRGWTAKRKESIGEEVVLVNLTNQDFNHAPGQITGPYDSETGRIPVKIQKSGVPGVPDDPDDPEGAEVMIRPRNIAKRGSAAALAQPRTPAEVAEHWLRVESEGGRISSANVAKIKASPPCGCTSCSRACWVQPGIYGPLQIEDLYSRGQFRPDKAVLDFYESEGEPPVAYIRPSTVEEEGCSLAPLTPLSGAPCVNLGPNGCTLTRDEMPMNCKALSCDGKFNVTLDKHAAARTLWLTPEGERVVRLFQLEILKKNPQAPTTKAFHDFETMKLFFDPNACFAHELSCAQLPKMVTMATEKMTQMMISPDPQIMHIILEQIRRREPYLTEMEQELFSILKKGTMALSMMMSKLRK